MKIIGQTNDRKAEDKAKKLAIKRSQAKEANQIANEELRGFNACVKFLNSEKGKEALKLKGIDLDKEITRSALSNAFEAIDEAKVERKLNSLSGLELNSLREEFNIPNDIKSSEMIEAILVKTGKLIQYTKDGQLRKQFSNGHLWMAAKYIFTAAKYITKK